MASLLSNLWMRLSWRGYRLRFLRKLAGQGALQFLAGGIAGLQFKGATDVSACRFRPVFSQIEASKNQVSFGGFADAQSGLGLHAGFARVAASFVIFGEGSEGRGV